MELNVDLLVAGCNTRCRHCYVRGGPGRRMPLEDLRLCLAKLDEIAALLPFPASFTLDNEPIAHPEIGAILDAASQTAHIRHYHHGMTTGIALMERPDRAELIRRYLDCGCRDFGITLHSGEAHHDEIVRRTGAFRASIEAAAFLRDMGAELNVSLMLNRFFPGDAEEIDRVLRKLEPSFVYFAIPNYTPHADMPGFEPYRATLSDLQALLPRLQDWGQDADALLERAAQCTVAAVKERLEGGLSLRALFEEGQDELYCTVHPDCRLYLGNTGVETACLGDLRRLDAAETAEILAKAPGNRDYGAFYDLAELPGETALIGALERLDPGLLYADLPSVLYRGLAELHIPTRILDT